MSHQVPIQRPPSQRHRRGFWWCSSNNKNPPLLRFSLLLSVMLCPCHHNHHAATCFSLVPQNLRRQQQQSLARIKTSTTTTSTTRIRKATTTTTKGSGRCGTLPPSRALSSSLSLGGCSNTRLGSSVATAGSDTNTDDDDKDYDIVIVGGGLAGLSAALNVKMEDPSRRVTVLDERDLTNDGGSSGNNNNDCSNNNKMMQASMAAAGMLAPHAERLPAGPYLDLCLKSRDMYPQFCSTIESIASQATREVREKYLYNNNGNSDDSEDDVSVRYTAAGGFLAPAFAGDAVSSWAPPQSAEDGDSSSNAAIWLDRAQVRALEPNLSPDVVGGWWFPEDASVDARRLTCTLRTACVHLGVDLQCNTAVTALDIRNNICHGIWQQQQCSSSSSSSSSYRSAKSVLVAAGAWIRRLLPVPVHAHKGQSICLAAPNEDASSSPPLLQRVLFAQDCYLVPRDNGRRIVAGATVEPGVYSPAVTVGGIMHVLQFALQLVPALSSWTVEETWAGLRPTTADKEPVLGRTPWDNVYVAAGYWRNGVLLAPATGRIMSDLILGRRQASGSDEDERYLKAFSWDRFLSSTPDQQREQEQRARYTSEMHPVPQYTSAGTGGGATLPSTELGTRSSARAAAEQRKRDRQRLLSSTDDNDPSQDDALERAAQLGKQDAVAFVNFGVKETKEEKPETTSSSSSDMDTERGSKETNDDDDDFLTRAYEKIRKTKSDNIDNNNWQQQRQAQQEQQDENKERRSDPGFRIFHVDEETGKSTEVPPYTSPGDFLKQQQAAQRAAAAASTAAASAADSDRIIDAVVNGEYKSSDNEEPPIDSSDDGNDGGTIMSNAAAGASSISQAYQTILRNKMKSQQQQLQNNAVAAGSTTKGKEEEQEQERPDPGFRIYHVDEETNERTMVPPYTSPGDFLHSLRQQKQKQKQDDSGDDSSSGDASRRRRQEQQQAPTGSSRSGTAASGSSSDGNNDNTGEQYNEKTFDGYQIIQNANTRTTREEELKAMREARRQNRLGQERIDPADIGAMRPPRAKQQ